MAKKFVRGITDVKTITNQDFDTNNVNDLLSDGQYNYIHRKKGKNEEYHNLTDNIKTLSSDNTELLSVTNYNKTTNTATLHPKHDAQKEQLLESTRNTITINHGENGTAEKTTVDTNPQKVLEHENLHTTYGISKSTASNVTTLGLEYTRVESGFDLNNLENGRVRGENFVNCPTVQEGRWLYVSSFKESTYAIQEAIALVDNKNTTYRRTKQNGVWGEWRVQVSDKSVIDELLSQKQDVLTAGTGITIQGNTISASGSTHTIQEFTLGDGLVNVIKNDVESGDYTLTTFSFDCLDATAEYLITGELKEKLKAYIYPDHTFSNGAVSITNDGTNMKLINSAPSINVHQQGTFTFYSFNPDGGGDV